MPGPEEGWQVALRVASKDYEKKLVDALADRDRQWIEAIAPGNSTTDFGKQYSTPEKYAEFAKASRELGDEDAAFHEAQFNWLSGLIIKVREACDAVVSCGGSSGPFRRHVLPLFKDFAEVEKEVARRREMRQAAGVQPPVPQENQQPQEP